MTPSSGVSTAPPFKFQLRRESVDWRRINAVDIDMVVSQIDMDALQEHIHTVTFCSLDGERCPRCQSPVDSALIKLVRLAQLSIEWLLYCQEFLTLSLQAMEEKLAAAGREYEQLLGQRKKQEEKVKMLQGELKQRKKVIRTQQTLLAPGIINSHKCLHCEKSFLSLAYLQNHMQRRHPEDYEMQLRSDSEKKSEIDSLKSEITFLKEQIIQQQQALQTKIAQEKEQESLQRDLLRELDRFKAEEMARMDRKIEDSRDGMRREIEFMYTRNIQALNEANQQQSARQEKTISPVQLQPEKDLDNYKEMQKQAIHKLEQQLKKQDRKWESRLQDIKAQHDSEKNQLLDELNRIQLSMSEQQEHSQRLQHELGRKLHEKEQTIKAQREQMKIIASNPPAKVVETQVLLTSPATEPKPKRVVLESSSLSERKQVEKKPEPVEKQRTTISALKMNPNIKKEIRPELEKSVEKRLESLGIKPGQCGITKKEMESILAKVHSKRQSTARESPDYWICQQEINTAVEEKLTGQKRGNEPDPRNKQMQVLQIRPRSSSLPSKAAHVMSRAAVRQPKTPQPTPRRTHRPQPKTSTPNTKAPQRNYSSNSDEESEEETDTEELQQDQRSQSSLVQSKARTPVLTTSSALESRGFVSGVTKTAVSKMDSEEEDEDWSDISELQEIDPNRLQGFKDQNGNVEKKSFGKENKINDLAKKMEKQFAERLGKKPVGGISILPERKDEIQELTYTDLEESSEWVVSSLEEKQDIPKPAQSSGPMRKSLDSASTSVWGTSTGKGPKSGLTEAGTGSTLKSSLYSLSDISDSEDISNKQ